MENIIPGYIQKHSKSEELHKEATQLFAADGATHSARIMAPFRPYITHAKGSRKWDEDNNEYIDYIMGHGALILGYSHPDIVRAIQEQATKGVHYGDNHQLEIQWAQLIRSMMPCMENIEFCASGLEANLLGIRIARIFTGRKKILRFHENFHGWADEIGPENAPGVVNDQVKVLPMADDLDLVEKELCSQEYALIMVEGGGAHMAGQVPWRMDFVRSLPAMAHKYGTLLLLDEVVTGFRDAPGGWQSLVGVIPDLTTVGKAIGGGLGVGAVGGREQIMAVLKPKAVPQSTLTHTGTWNANPLTAAAGVAACRHYRGGSVQERLNELGTYFRIKGNEVFEELKVSARFYGRSIIHFYLGPIEYDPGDYQFPPSKELEKIVGNKPLRTRLMMYLYGHGIAVNGVRYFIMSTAHTENDIDITIEALRDSIKAMISEGSLQRTE